jgi:hypothetical protein
MPIVFYCDRCNERISAVDSLEGQHIQCPSCEFGLTVPSGTAPQPGPEPVAMLVPLPLSPGRGSDGSRGDVAAGRLSGFAGWCAIVVGVLGIFGGIVHLANSRGVGEGHALYFWTLTLLPGIAALLVGILVLALRSWFRHFACLLARSGPARENESPGR